MKDNVRAVFVKLGDSPDLLCYLAWRDICFFAFHIESCMHVEILAKFISRHACLLEHVNKLPLLFYHTNISDPVGNFMCPFKACPIWEALPQVDEPCKHLLLGANDAVASAL